MAKDNPPGLTRINPDEALLASAPDNLIKGVGAKLGASLLTKMPKTQAAITQLAEKTSKLAKPITDKIEMTAEKIKELTDKVRTSGTPAQKEQIKLAIEKLRTSVPEVKSVKFPDLGKTTKQSSIKDGITSPSNMMDYSTDPTTMTRFKP